MKLDVEIEFEADYHEDTEGNWHLRGLRFPGCTQNLLPNLSREERVKAQAELDWKRDKEILAKAQAVMEKNERAQSTETNRNLRGFCDG